MTYDPYKMQRTYAHQQSIRQTAYAYEKAAEPKTTPLLKALQFISKHFSPKPSTTPARLEHA